MSELNQEQLDYLEYCKAKFQRNESPLSFYDWQWLSRVEDQAKVSYRQGLDDEAMQKAYKEAESFYLPEDDYYPEFWDEWDGED